MAVAVARARMLAMASQRSDGSFVKKDDPLSHALATLGLHMYVDQFKQVGWDDIDFMRTLSGSATELELGSPALS